MARLFGAGPNKYLEVASAVLSANPITMACWFYSSDITAKQHLMCIGSTTKQDGFLLSARGDVAGDPLKAQSTFGGLGGSGTTTSGYSANTWHHACGVYASTTDRRAFIDGGSKGTNTTEAIPESLDRTLIGIEIWQGAYWNPTLGRIAEAAWWNVALTDADVAVLATGVSPLFVRPENLFTYLPLVRDNDKDIVGGVSFTANGSPTIATHPPVIYPAPPIFYMKASAAGAYFQSATGLLTPTGIISKETSKVFTGAIAASGTLIRQTNKAFTGSVTASGVLGAVKTALRSIGGSLTPSGTLTRQTSKALAGSVTSVGTLIKRIAKAFTGSVTMVGTLATIKTVLKAITGSLTMAGTLVRQTNKQAVGILTMTGSIAKRISKSITGVITAVGTLFRQLAGLPTPDRRIYAIPSENRVYAIASENRIYPIPG